MASKFWKTAGWIAAPAYMAGKAAVKGIKKTVEAPKKEQAILEKKVEDLSTFQETESQKELLGMARQRFGTGLTGLARQSILQQGDRATAAALGVAKGRGAGIAGLSGIAQAGQDAALRLGLSEQQAQDISRAGLERALQGTQREQIMAQQSLMDKEVTGINLQMAKQQQAVQRAQNLAKFGTSLIGLGSSLATGGAFGKGGLFGR